MELNESSNSFKCAPLKQKINFVKQTKSIKTNLTKSNTANFVETESDLEKNDALDINQEINKFFSISILTTKNSTLGKGTYGIVRNGLIYVNNQLDENDSAIKTFLGRDGIYFSQTVLREIVPLCSLPYHENVLKPRIVFMDEKSRIHFATELMKCNLHDRLKKSSCTLQQKLQWSLQLTEAVHHMHSNGFLHRDIKLENIFLDSVDNVILGDLGMSRFTCPFISPQFSSGVCTLWTRAPELCSYALDGQRNSREATYTSSVDSFSLGVTILSIFASRYFFQGKDEEEMLHLFFSILGKPSDDIQSDFWGSSVTRETRHSKPKWKSIAANISLESKNTEDVFSSILVECSKRNVTVHPDLIRSLLPLLAIEPNHRGTAYDLLQHPFWISAKDTMKIKVKSTDLQTFKTSNVCTLNDKLKHKYSQSKLKTAILDEHILYCSREYYNSYNSNALEKNIVSDKFKETKEKKEFKAKEIDILNIKGKNLQTEDDEPLLEFLEALNDTNLLQKQKPLFNSDVIYNSCTTQGILRLAVTEWILSLKKSLDLQYITVIDSILFWEKVRDLVDVEVKNEMVLAAACCSLISKVHEYTIFSNSRWIRCLSNSATVDELVKYELLALKTSNCKMFIEYYSHPVTLLNTAIKDQNLLISDDQREKILLSLCSFISKNHTRESEMLRMFITNLLKL
jgi:serine/threonine protein kinase